MGKPTERESASGYAVEMIDKNLEQDFLGAAIMVARNYVKLRLGSLITDYYACGSKKTPKKRGASRNWTEIAALFRDAQVHTLVKRSEDLGIISKQEAGKIGNLFDIRNTAAHKIDLWKRPKKGNKKYEDLRRRVDSACDAAKAFLNRTSNPKPPDGSSSKE